MELFNKLNISRVLALFLPLIRAKGVVGQKVIISFIFDMFTHLSVIFCLHTPTLLFLFGCLNLH